MAAEHGAQAGGHQQGHGDVDGEKQGDGGHGREMDDPGGVEVAKCHRQRRQLNRLPDGQPAQDGHPARADDTDPARARAEGSFAERAPGAGRDPLFDDAP